MKLLIPLALLCSYAGYASAQHTTFAPTVTYNAAKVAAEAATALAAAQSALPNCQASIVNITVDVSNSAYHSGTASSLSACLTRCVNHPFCKVVTYLPRLNYAGVCSMSYANLTCGAVQTIDLITEPTGPQTYACLSSGCNVPDSLVNQGGTTGAGGAATVKAGTGAGGSHTTVGGGGGGSHTTVVGGGGGSHTTVAPGGGGGSHTTVVG